MFRPLLLPFVLLSLAACGQSGDLYLPGSPDAPTRVDEIGGAERGEDDTDAATDDDKDNDDDAEQRSDAR